MERKIIQIDEERCNGFPVKRVEISLDGRVLIDTREAELAPQRMEER